MARKALIVKQQRLQQMMEKYHTLAKQAKEEGKELPRPRRYKPSKYYNRCGLSGKTRSYMRDFGVSRQAFRRYARDGLIMGLRKASW